MANEKRLIDANAFQLDPDPNGVMNGVLIVGGERERIMTMAQLALKRMIDNAPTVDAVEVVRCKDCIHWHEGIAWCDQHSHFDEDEWNMFDADDFCSYGERRTDNG